MERVVLITGCSSGFGYLTAKLLSQSGYIVYATVRKEKDLQVFASLPKSIQPKTILLDITWSQEKIDQIIKNIITKEKQLDVLVNNAGFGYLGTLSSLTAIELEEQMATNVIGLFKVTKSVLPQMRTQKNSLIINLSSIFGLTVSLCYGAYSASKFAVEALAKTLRLEESRFGIRVCCINPGSFETDFRHKEKFSQSEPDSDQKIINQKIKKLLNVPHHRGDPNIVASLIKRIIETKNPKPNYLVGLDAWGIYILSNLFSPSTRDWLVRFIRRLT